MSVGYDAAGLSFFLHLVDVFSLYTNLFDSLILCHSKSAMQLPAEYEKDREFLLHAVEERNKTHTKFRFRPTSTTPCQSSWSIFGLVATCFLLGGWLHYSLTRGASTHLGTGGGQNGLVFNQVGRRYNLTVGARWMNLGMST